MRERDCDDWAQEWYEFVSLNQVFPMPFRSSNMQNQAPFFTAPSHRYLHKWTPLFAQWRWLRAAVIQSRSTPSTYVAPPFAITSFLIRCPLTRCLSMMRLSRRIKLGRKLRIEEVGVVGEGPEGGEEVGEVSEVEEGEAVGEEFECRFFDGNAWISVLAPNAKFAIRVSNFQKRKAMGSVEECSLNVERLVNPSIARMRPTGKKDSLREIECLIP